MRGGRGRGGSFFATPDEGFGMEMNDDHTRGLAAPTLIQLAFTARAMLLL